MTTIQMVAALIALVIVLHFVRWLRSQRPTREDLARLDMKLDALIAEAGSKLMDVHASMPRDYETDATVLWRVERKTDALLRAYGLEDSVWPPIPDHVRQLWRERRKVEAVREYRELNPQLGLREAKLILEWALRE